MGGAKHNVRVYAPRVKCIMKGKATLLLLELAKEVGFRDKDLADELHGGFKIIGEILDCAEFPFGRTEALLDVEGLDKVALWSQHAVKHQL